MQYTQEFIRRFWSKVDKRGDDECWPWMASVAGKGYGQIKIPGTRRNTYSHRMAYELTHGPLPAGQFACHRCDNPCCCNPSHLFAGTAKANQSDMAKKKRSTWGSRNSQSKLTSNDVDFIFKAYSLGVSQEKIASIIGCTQMHVSRILRRERWGQYVPPTQE